MASFLYAGDLVLCAKMKESLKAMEENFIEVCKRRGLKVRRGNYVWGLYKWAGRDTQGAFCMNQVYMVLNTEVRWRERGNFRVLSYQWWILGVSNLSIRGYRIRHCSHLFCYMVVRQWYGSRKRGLRLGLYRWTTWEVCWVLGKWIERVSNPRIRELHERRREWMKGLTKVFFDGSAKLKGWGMIRLLKGHM